MCFWPLLPPRNHIRQEVSGREAALLLESVPQITRRFTGNIHGELSEKQRSRKLQMSSKHYRNVGNVRNDREGSEIPLSHGTN